MKVEIHLLSQSRPVVRDHVTNTYTKGEVYCLYTKGQGVEKYPLINIFRIKEDY